MTTDQSDTDDARRRVKTSRAIEAERFHHCMMRLDGDTWHCRYCPAQWNDKLYAPKNNEAIAVCKNAPRVATTYVYVLTREHSDLSGYEVLRVFVDENRANEDLELVKNDHGMKYRVHAVMMLL